MILSSSVKNGELQLSPQEKDAMKRYASSLEGKTVWLTISDVKPPRTMQQNSYYWGVIVQMISDETGMTQKVSTII